MAKSKGKRSNAPAATVQVKSGDADARKFASFSKCGGVGGDPVMGSGAKTGGVAKGLPTKS